MIGALIWSVALMHTSLPMPTASMPAQSPQAQAQTQTQTQIADWAVALTSADQTGARQAKATPDAVCSHGAHLCAGTVVVHPPLHPPGLVTVLARTQWRPGTRDDRGLACARGPPPWTCPDLHQLSILRI